MPKTAPKDKAAVPAEPRASILPTLTSPLKVLGLIVLVVEAVIALLAARADAAAVPSLIYAMIGVLALVVIVVGVGLIVSSRAPAAPAGPPPEPIKYDVFVSAPMAAYATAEQFAENNREVIAVIDSLRRDCGLDAVFYAGQSITGPDDFDLAETSLEEDLRALRQSRLFLMIYPEKIASSVLVEAGAALALNKLCVFFVRDRSDLPFVLRNADADRAAEVRVHEYADYDDLRATLRKKGALGPLPA
jgi:hypothetical protein